MPRTPATPLYAGSINQSGELEYASGALADDSTTIARIIRAVEEAQAGTAPMQRFVDVFARFYTPAIFAAALLTALVPPLLFGGVWTEWLYTALVLLVIGCPCALVISTPVTIVSGMARRGAAGQFWSRAALFLEQGRRLRCLALDKTGTITHGSPRQTDFLPLSDDPRLRALAAGLASRSDHPRNPGPLPGRPSWPALRPHRVADFAGHSRAGRQRHDGRTALESR